jgi:predicted NAD/FAD-binding protein
MRIGIVGGGAAGLAAAYLLQDEHLVTIFEAEGRLGGHAHTVVVEQAGERAPIDAGFEFFSARRFPTFARLLGRLGVPVRPYPLTATFYRTDQRYTVLLPPVRDGRLAWSVLGLRQVLDLLQLAYALQAAGPLMRARDTSVTLADYLRRLPLLGGFKRDFMAPFLLAGWCPAPEEFLGFSAYDVLSYAYWHRPVGLRPHDWLEVEGGTQVYIAALAEALARVVVHTTCSVVAVERKDTGYALRTADGGLAEFDQVILATNARVASRLLDGLPRAEAFRAALGQVQYFPTRIAVHGDTRLMPGDRRHWSVTNIRCDGRMASNTVWKGWRSRAPVFRSWVTHEPRLPEPLYYLAEFEHPKVNAAYFRAQAQLRPLQGQEGLWLAGVYLHDVDSHESAVVSAVQLAQRLAPASTRLRALEG